MGRTCYERSTENKCEIAIRGSFVEAEIEKKIKDILNRYKISDEKNPEEFYAFFWSRNNSFLV